MLLSRALRLSRSTAVAFVGGGGKTSALFLAARELAPAIVSTSTHLAARQAVNADRHIVWNVGEALPPIPPEGVTLVTGPYREDIARVSGLDFERLAVLRALAAERGLPLLMEADGSRQKPLKAPAAHEPAIPPFVDVVVVTAGMKGLGRPLDETFFHRPEIYATLTGLAPGERVDVHAAARVLLHAEGGLKNIPTGARRLALLNQADTPELQSQAGELAALLLPAYAGVTIASLQRGLVLAVRETVAGVILAAGQASRFGQPKQLLDFHGLPFVRRAAQAALGAGLHPVVVVLGAYEAEVQAVLHDLPVIFARSHEWREGQAASIRAGVEALTDETQAGAAIFLLADQPQVTPHLLSALVERHAESLAPIIAPLVADRRANPVLFDRDLFAALAGLQGDVGGRALFRHFPLEYLPWQDESLLLDVDTPEDYRRLLAWGVAE